MVADQLMKNAQLNFMITGIFERIVPVSLEVAPGDDLSVLSLVLGRIKVAAEQPGPIYQGSECPVETSQQIQLDVWIQLVTSIGTRFVMIGRGDIDFLQFDFSPRTVQQREERAPAPVLQ